MMQKPALYSAILHAVVFIILLVGIPLPQRHIDVSEQPIILEFTKIDTISKAPVLSPENSKKEETKPIKKPEPPKEEPKVEEAKEEPKEEAKEEPKVEEAPEPIKEKEPEPEPDPVPVPKKDPVKKEEPKKEKKEEKKTPPKKDENKKKAKKEVKNDKAIVDLKKKKSKPKPLAKSKSADELIDSLLGDTSEDQGQNSAPAQMVGDEITATEIDAIRERIYKCWLVPPGVKDAKNLVVDIQMSISREGVVQKAEVINKNLMGNANFEAAAESAQRAVLDPNCNPLPLSPDKYDQWKDLTLRFNPKDMY